MTISLPSLTPEVEALLRRWPPSSLPLTRSSEHSSGDNYLDAFRGNRHQAQLLFKGARDPQAACSGLLLLAGAWAASHQVSQDLDSREGSYWHAIAHRMEPDDFNASYWFRRVGQHVIFPALHQRASQILKACSPLGWTLPAQWDPFRFIEWASEAREAGNDATGMSAREAARAIQEAEWELLFAWCAEPSR